LDSPNNTIGGTAAGAGNLIAGNLDPDYASVGIGFPASTGNLVQGNFVGTDITGTIALGGASIAVYIAEGSSNTIGGTIPGAANLISGGGSSGVGIASASGNFVQGNLIGTQADGVTPLANGSHGVLIYSGAANNTVGGRTAGAGNTIAFNGVSGVDLRGDAGVGNTIAGNSIFGNTALEIDFCSDFDVDNLMCNDATKVTPNDPKDPDTGANNLQNHPELVTFLSGSTVSGFLDSIPNAEFTVDIYASRWCDPSGHGGGEIYLGSAIVTTDAYGVATFSTLLPGVAPEGWYAVATATDSAGSTSEFSQCIEVLSELIFSDGFDSGGTTIWSAVMP
jgi:titin